ncbi:hypothetical protein I4F81_008834 [Pyropia yezoensis]|uniref:Uncharacterized protein n=1 Tax=Pyropia yezoensis TaxID=2788 RepID=A0ACC3C7M7_PYRYE|nr:hypothetical protein I4F81_008834 [Neopyropia yezoensis]
MQPVVGPLMGLRVCPPAPSLLILVSFFICSGGRDRTRAALTHRGGRRRPVSASMWGWRRAAGWLPMPRTRTTAAGTVSGPLVCDGKREGGWTAATGGPWIGQRGAAAGLRSGAYPL